MQLKVGHRVTVLQSWKPIIMKLSIIKKIEMSNRESIKVVCRVRPLNKIELSGNFQNCVTHDDYMMTVKVSQQRDNLLVQY